MLIVLIVIEVAAVLLDLIHTERGGINGLGAQAVSLKLALDLALLLTVGILDPDGLNVGTLQNVVPLAVVLTGVRLRRGEEVGLVEGVREHQGHLIPELLGFAGQRLEGILKVVKRLRPGIRSPLERLLGLEDLLLGQGGRGSAQEQRGCCDLHGARYDDTTGS